MARPIGGMMTPSTSVVTIFPNAAPMITPTARSTTLPRAMNSLNSFSMARLLSTGGAVRKHHRRGGGELIVVADEPLGLRGVVGRQVMGPPIAHNLVSQFDVNGKGASRSAGSNAIADRITAAGEIRISQRAAVHGNVRLRGRFVEPARQQPIVLREIDGLEQPGRRFTSLVL